MKKKSTIHTEYEAFESLADLPTTIRELMIRAQEARNNAYAPYSKFMVGAAILMESGEITSGSNQENAAYPSGLCAERVAIFHTGAKFPNEPMVAMAISAKAPSQILEEPIGPCGACRQSMAEYEQKQGSPIAVYFMGEKGKIVKLSSVMDFLPFGFDAKYL